jgi:hypothetical protein
MLGRPRFFEVDHLVSDDQAGARRASDLCDRFARQGMHQRGTVGGRSGERPLGNRKDRGVQHGIFAIAITLLVLEISVPESDFDNLWKGIADQWPSYLGYATSFLTIGGLWLVHHAIFRRLAERGRHGDAVQHPCC